MRRVRGFSDLIFDLVDRTTNLCERTHDAVLERTRRRFTPIEPASLAVRTAASAQTAISSGVFDAIRLINGVARRTVDAVADLPGSAGRAGPPSPAVDQLQSLVNGWCGDRLADSGSSLDLSMTVCHEGRPLPLTATSLAAAFPGATSKICVFVHGLGANERLWRLSSREHYGEADVTFGTRLRDDLGYTPVYLRYNTGRHVSENGKALATLLGDLHSRFPVPIEQIVLVGHSMGGLVARSAAHYARERDDRWLADLRHVVCIGSPHLGAPLEKAARLFETVLGAVDAAGAQVPAEILATRSAGIKDLRHGYTVDEEWLDEDSGRPWADARRDLPPVDGVGYSFIATTISRDPDHPLGRLLGDLLVRLPSATGDAPEPARRVRFDGGAVVPGMSHAAIANHPTVYAALRGLLDPATPCA